MESVKASVQWHVEIVTHVPAGAPQQLGLEVTVINAEGSMTPAQLLIPTKPPEMVPRSREDLQGRRDFFMINLPKGFQPAAVYVRNRPEEGDSVFQKHGRYSDFYLKLLSFTAAAPDSSSGPVHMLANSYISTQQGKRLFVCDNALTDKDLRDKSALKQLMLEELKELRGEGSNQAEADKPRSGPERIYRYAMYNDLGGDIVKHPDFKRPTLGGSQYPYPRRLATNRGLYDGTDSEKAPDADQATLVYPEVLSSIVSQVPVVGSLAQKVVGTAVKDGVAATPWVPKDDNFDTDKTRGFLGTALVGLVQSFTSRVFAGREFESEGEVLSLYSKSERPKFTSTLGKMLVDIPSGGRGDFEATAAGLPRFRINTRDGKQLPQPSSAANDANLEAEGRELDLSKFPAPRCLIQREDTWKDDEEMGRLFLTGQNPMVIEVLDSQKLKTIWDDPTSSIKDIPLSTQEMLLEGQSLEQCAAAEGTGEPKLLLVDYWDLYGLLGALTDANKDGNRVQHAGRCILLRNSQKKLVPVVIELAHSKLEPVQTYTAVDHPHVWQVAKAIFQSVDSVWHQLISHWLRTHACIEPFMLAMRRQLPAAHPMFRLLMPHFRYTLAINAAARGALVNASGFVEDSFSTGSFSMQLTSVMYGRRWEFKNEGLFADLKQRGFLDAAGSLRVSDYPYAEDGLLIWNALTDYFTKYVNMYYPSDASVWEDEWLKAWWEDATTKGHPEANQAGWVPLDSRANLVLAATTIAWVASAHHAAVNFGQYDLTGWMPSHSSLCRRPAPARGSSAWQALENAREPISKEFFTYVAPPDVTTRVMSIMQLLSAHAQDEQYLSTDAQDWLPLETDTKVKEVFESFVTTLKQQVEPEIERRNKDPNRPSRWPESKGMAYTLMYPSSAKPGVTMMGIPYSISI